MPTIDGMELCRRVRASGGRAPILMLTARAEERDCVLGLESGADDYVVKPFSVVEFAARAKAMMRRAERLSGPPGIRSDVLCSGDLLLDLERRAALRAGLSVDLTAKEFDLLAHFMRNPARVYSRAQLLEDVWGARDNYEHTVNSHINRLRAKIEPDPANPSFVVTVWGVGYRFNARGDPAFS